MASETGTSLAAPPLCPYPCLGTLPPSRAVNRLESCTAFATDSETTIGLTAQELLAKPPSSLLFLGRLVDFLFLVWVRRGTPGLLLGSVMGEALRLSILLLLIAG